MCSCIAPQEPAPTRRFLHRHRRPCCMPRLHLHRRLSSFFWKQPLHVWEIPFFLLPFFCSLFFLSLRGLRGETVRSVPFRQRCLQEPSLVEAHCNLRYVQTSPLTVASQLSRVLLGDPSIQGFRFQGCFSFGMKKCTTCCELFRDHARIGSSVLLCQIPTVPVPAIAVI